MLSTNLPRALGASLLLFCLGAKAQFVGDVFARVPSIAAPAGGQASVEVQLFAGANVFGASIVQLTFQPSQLAVREVLLSGASGQRRVAVDRKSDGRVEIATFSTDGSRNPIGTVTLAQIVFDVLAPPGTLARYQITPREVISQNEVRFTSLRGAAGEVVVTSAALNIDQQLRSATAALLVSDPASLARAAALRPRGGAVELVMPVQRGTEITAQTVKVQPAPAANSE